jgi:hypothetical protein
MAASTAAFGALDALSLPGQYGVPSTAPAKMAADSPLPGTIAFRPAGRPFLPCIRGSGSSATAWRDRGRPRESGNVWDETVAPARAPDEPGCQTGCCQIGLPDRPAR